MEALKLDRIADTEWICAHCEEYLPYKEEVIRLAIVRPQVQQNTVVLHLGVTEEVDAVEYDYHQFCLSCWEDLFGDLLKEAKDCPPVPDALGILNCQCCGSSIREWEKAGAVSLGEFRHPQRAPNHRLDPVFHPISQAKVVCLYCIAVMNEFVITLWDELAQNAECIDCTHARCWRTSGCSCACHVEEPEDS